MNNSTKNRLLQIILKVMIFLSPIVVFPGTKILYMPKAVVLYTFSGCLVILLFLRRKELKFDKIDKLLGMFLALALLSTAFSINIKVSIFGIDNSYEGIIMLMIYALIYYVSKYYLSYNKNFTIILFIQSTIISIIAIFQFYMIEPIYSFFNISGKTFACGTLGYHNYFGSYITMFLPIAMYLYVLTNKKTYLGLSMLFFTGMTISLTRSAWVAFTICFVIIFINFYKHKGFIKRLIILSLIFFSIFYIIYMTNNFLKWRIISGVVEDVKNVSTKGMIDKLGSGRIKIWRQTMRIVEKYPLLGCGVDTLEYTLVSEFTDFIKENDYKSFNKAHNEYLQIVATMGIPAGSIYIIFIFLNLKETIKKNKANKVLIISIVGYLIQAFFNISTIGVAPLFWMLLGLNMNEKFTEKVSNNIEVGIHT